MPATTPLTIAFALESGQRRRVLWRPGDHAPDGSRTSATPRSRSSAAGFAGDSLVEALADVNATERRTQSSRITRSPSLQNPSDATETFAPTSAESDGARSRLVSRRRKSGSAWVCTGVLRVAPPTSGRRPGATFVHLDRRPQTASDRRMSRADYTRVLRSAATTVGPYLAANFLISSPRRLS
jgi:hypothetical protein